MLRHFRVRSSSHLSFISAKVVLTPPHAILFRHYRFAASLQGQFEYIHIFPYLHFPVIWRKTGYRERTLNKIEYFPNSGWLHSIHSLGTQGSNVNCVWPEFIESWRRTESPNSDLWLSLIAAWTTLKSRSKSQINLLVLAPPTDFEFWMTSERNFKFYRHV